METITSGQHTPVAGFVRGKRLTRDGNFVFRIVNQWFSLPQRSTFAREVLSAERAIVCFEQTGRKYPRVISVIPNYTGEQLRDATS